MSVNTFVSEFLQQYDREGTLLKKWESIKNQRKLKKILKENNKDPTKPKRGKSGFLFFCDEKRPLIKESNKDIKVKEVVSQLGTLWQELKKDGKTEQYDILSEKDRERYRIEMVVYRNKIKSGIATPKVKKTPRKKETPLDLYIKSKKMKLRDKNPELNDATMEKLLKDRWKKLPLAKRLKYIIDDDL
jgi:hypothetical protein